MDSVVIFVLRCKTTRRNTCNDQECHISYTRVNPNNIGEGGAYIALGLTVPPLAVSHSP